MRSLRSMREWRGRCYPRPLQLGRACGCASLIVGAWLAAADGAAPGPVTAPVVHDVLVDLLGELRTRQLVPTAEGELRRTACQALLDAFASGGVVVEADAAAGARPVPVPPKLTRVEGRSGRFGYLEIGAVDAGLREALAEARKQLSGEGYDGTVVDLRDSAGNDLCAAAECAALIDSWGHPAVVIVDGRTRAAAEVLAADLRTAHGAVILGEPTRGLPYPLRPVRLRGDLDVMLPEVPAGTRVNPLQPDVPVRPEAAGDRGSWGPRPNASSGVRQRDDRVRQALDLLTAIATFQQKHF